MPTLINEYANMATSTREGKMLAGKMHEMMRVMKQLKTANVKWQQMLTQLLEKNARQCVSPQGKGARANQRYLRKGTEVLVGCGSVGIPVMTRMSARDAISQGAANAREQRIAGLRSGNREPNPNVRTIPESDSRDCTESYTTEDMQSPDEGRFRRAKTHEAMQHNAGEKQEAEFVRADVQGQN